MSSLNALGFRGKELSFGNVDGGEFWNLQVDVDAVVEPDDEDDCKEVEENLESACMLELLPVTP